MARYDGNTQAIIKRLQQARLSIMAKYPFYAMLLMHMKFALDLTCETAYTNGNLIAFNPDFMNNISDPELEFVLMHEVLHAALRHPYRHQADYKSEAFDQACDIVVNSNILYSMGMDKRKITVQKYGEAMHTTPNGEEGYKFTVEEVYKFILAAIASSKNAKKKKNSNNQPSSMQSVQSGVNSNGGTDSKQSGDETSSGENGGTKSGKGGGGCGRSDPSKQGKNKNPTKDDLEQLINSIKQRNQEITAQSQQQSKEMSDTRTNDSSLDGRIDDHSFWEGESCYGTERDIWLQRMIEATDIIAKTTSSKGRGTVPLAAERIIQELRDAKLDWRTILNDFIQEEICDYSFAPPDKRMEDSPFFLPDFNEKDEAVKDILFMIDTSGSMGDDAITECYSEIYGAIMQFNGKLQGKLGFFDAVVVEPTEFTDEEEFKIIRPKGGGGTSFHIIFDYVKEKMIDNPPVSIVILTDGYAPFPDVSDTDNIPVLWIINNNAVEPPWGKVARLIEKAN